MAIFKAGQRVKAVRGEPWEGTFIKYIPVRRDFSPLPADCKVIWDDKNQEWFEASTFLVPAIPERNHIVAWESLPIDPRKIGEPA